MTETNEKKSGKGTSRAGAGSDKGSRAAHLTLLGIFLALIVVVPVAQAIIDVKVEEESKPFFLTLFTQSPSEKNLRDFEDKLEESSYFEQKVRPFFQYWRYYALRDLGEKALRGDEGWYFYTPGLRYLVEPYFRELTTPPKTDPVEAIADFRRQLKERGIRLLVVPVPGKASVYPDKLVGGLEPGVAYGDHTARFIGELRKKGVEVLALNPVYQAARKARPKEQLYMAADTHWTGAGVKLTAETIAAVVRKQPWYRAHKARTTYTRKTVKLKRRGDIPKMTRIPRQEQLFGEETVTAYQILDAEGELYEDPEAYKEAPILLMGDSFSRVFQTDEPESAGMIANLAYELHVPLSSIVNDGGASTLVRQALAQDLEILEGKKLVIYSFVERDIRFGMKGWPKIEIWGQPASKPAK